MWSFRRLRRLRLVGVRAGRYCVFLNVGVVRNRRYEKLSTANGDPVLVRVLEHIEQFKHPNAPPRRLKAPASPICDNLAGMATLRDDGLHRLFRQSTHAGPLMPKTCSLHDNGWSTITALGFSPPFSQGSAPASTRTEPLGEEDREKRDLISTCNVILLRRSAKLDGRTTR